MITKIEYDIGRFMKGTGNFFSSLSQKDVGNALGHFGDAVSQMQTGVPAADGSIKLAGAGLSATGGVIDNHSWMSNAGEYLMDASNRWQIMLNNDANPIDYWPTSW